MIDLSLPFNVLVGDSRESLSALPAGSVHCAVTSPPYFGLRAYKAGDREIGRESTVAAYLDGLLAVFREVRRVLRDDGLLWVNLGCSYAGAGDRRGPSKGNEHGQMKSHKTPDKEIGYKPGDLIDIPSLFAEAMRLDGWYLRSRVTWVKGVSCAEDYSGSCMPESAAANGTYWVRHRVKVAAVADRTHETGHRDYSTHLSTHPATEWRICPGCAKCNPHGGYILKRGNGRPTNSTEVVLMFAKTDSYYYDAEAVKEKQSVNPNWSYPKPKNYSRVTQDDAKIDGDNRNKKSYSPGWHTNINASFDENGLPNGSRCLRSAWWMPLENATESWFINPGGNSDVAGKHFAMFPMALPTLCIKQSTSERGVCPKCGAPWARVIEKGNGAKYTEQGNPQGENRSVMSWGDSHPMKNPDRWFSNGRTLDWRPTCGCGAGDPIPATVLDPFGGMMTTLVAAAKIGRRGIGCELNPEYARRGAERLRSVLGLMGTVELVESGGDDAR